MSNQTINVEKIHAVYDAGQDFSNALFGSLNAARLRGSEDGKTLQDTVQIVNRIGGQLQGLHREWFPEKLRLIAPFDHDQYASESPMAQSFRMQRYVGDVASSLVNSTALSMAPDRDQKIDQLQEKLNSVRSRLERVHYFIDAQVGSKA